MLFGNYYILYINISVDIYIVVTYLNMTTSCEWAFLEFTTALADSS